MARPARLDKPVKRTITLPGKISDHLDQRFADPVTGKIKHGALSKYILGLVVAELKTRNDVLTLIDEAE